MTNQSTISNKYITEARLTLSALGIEYVQVISADNPDACDYCRPMHGSIIPLTEISRLAEYCKKDQCCCQFEPSFDTD